MVTSAHQIIILSGFIVKIWEQWWWRHCWVQSVSFDRLNRYHTVFKLSWWINWKFIKSLYHTLTLPNHKLHFFFNLKATTSLNTAVVSIDFSENYAFTHYVDTNNGKLIFALLYI